MSAACHEDGRLLRVDKEAFAITSEKATAYAAICDEHIPQIARELRLDAPVEDGIDIHFLFSQPNGSGAFFGDAPDTLSLMNMELGDYRFSIPRELAKTILPQSLAFILHMERGI